MHVFSTCACPRPFVCLQLTLCTHALTDVPTHLATHQNTHFPMVECLPAQWCPDILPAAPVVANRKHSLRSGGHSGQEGGIKAPAQCTLLYAFLLLPTGRIPSVGGDLIACPRLSRPSQGLKVAVIEGADVGGTCVNRGCVPSKALLAASGRIREMRNASHLKQLGIQVCSGGCASALEDSSPRDGEMAAVWLHDRNPAHEAGMKVPRQNALPSGMRVGTCAPPLHPCMCTLQHTGP